MSIGTTGVKQICIVVKDAEESKKRWSAILGLQPTIDVEMPAYEDVPTITNNKPDHFGSNKLVVFKLKEGPVIELIQPDEGDSPWRRYLDKHGESVMNIAFYVSDRQKAYKVIEHACGTGQPYHEGFYPESTYSFVDTQQALGLELNIKCDEDNKEYITRLLKNRDT